MPDIRIVDIQTWIEKARADPVLFLERQATDLILNAIGAVEAFENAVFFKGGALMGIAYQSPRQTADLDFTTNLEPRENIDTAIRDALDRALVLTSARLGYPDMIAQVQSIDLRPRKEMFAQARFPAMKVKVAYARRASPQARGLARGNCPDVVEIDLSFNEPDADVQLIKLGEGGGTIRAYSLLDLIAEKLRALLQQEIRNRYRRQDIYDIALLLGQFSLSADQCRTLLGSFLKKCRARDIEPTIDFLSSPEVARRAQSEWATLSLEIGEVPPFDACFARVEAFYRGLPWDEAPGSP